MSNILAQTYDQAVAVTPSDSVADPAGPFAGLLVITAGSGLKFTDQYGNTVAMTGTIPVGTEIHVACSRVWSTGTGATVVGLIAMPYKRKAST
jgi:hypothetical protein